MSSCYPSKSIIGEGACWKGEKYHLSPHSWGEMAGFGDLGRGQFFFSLAALFVTARSGRNMDLITFKFFCIYIKSCMKFWQIIVPRRVSEIFLLVNTE